ncbi:MAG TPA: hypothetical protein PKY25_02000 [Bacilli bacterium]|nr:hypothetical protein [Bacilli bacterium]
MITKVININNYIRQTLYERSKGGLYFDEEYEDMQNYFENMRLYNYDLYKKVIGTIYCGYCLNSIYYDDFECEDGESVDNIMDFKNIDEVIDFLNKNESMLYVFIQKTIDFHALTEIEKREAIREAKHIEQLLLKINLYYIFDIYEYAGHISKEDLLAKHNFYHKSYDVDIKNTNYLESINESIYEVSIVYLSDYIKDIYEESYENYRELILDIIEDYYTYYKYLESSKIVDNKSIINSLESATIKKAINLTISNQNAFYEILSYFIEYNQKTESEKKKILTHNKKHNYGSIKTKIQQVKQNPNKD